MVVLLGLVGFAVVAVLRVPWDLLPDTRSLPAVRPSEVLDPTVLARATRYSATQRGLSLSSLGVSLLVALVLGLTRVGSRLLGRLRGWWWVRVLVGSLLLLLVGRVLTLPFALASRHESLEAGLSRQGLGSWVQDQVVALGVTTVYTAVAAIVLIGLARRAPRSWPVWCALVSAVLVVLGSFVYPVVVEPLNNQFASLPAGPLREGVLRLADREGVEVDDVLVADASRRTTTLNAYVTGFGATRRVVLWDNTVRDLPRDQVLSIVAHELGHARDDDVLTGTLLGAFGAVLGVGLLGLLLQPGERTSWWVRRSGAAGPHDVRVLALLLALTSAGELLATPVEDTVSRALEARADQTALRATRDPSAFEAMQRRLAAQSLGDPDPPLVYRLVFGTHPTTVQRIGAARAYAEGTVRAGR
ncbi:hypothetical protein GCM10011519_01110 [Marmoricola endophyticus]|uniref:M48 family peptidase n=1 Tax=Marmoricola endophyticus TaxID=2040280 RepID=A0A917B8R7_9ACTN|nr:hypothetical protein GCM10011519_01110 [Marmoricola endophyticus]